MINIRLHSNNSEFSTFLSIRISKISHFQRAAFVPIHFLPFEKVRRLSQQSSLLPSIHWLAPSLRSYAEALPKDNPALLCFARWSLCASCNRHIYMASTILLLVWQQCAMDY